MEAHEVVVNGVKLSLEERLPFAEGRRGELCAGEAVREKATPQETVAREGGHSFGGHRKRRDIHSREPGRCVDEGVVPLT